MHAYTLVPGGKTRYLAELRSGDPVALVKSDGTTRVTSVGRCKIEIRPFVYIEAEVGSKRYNVILQNAETVRVVGTKGSISVVDIKPGDEILAKCEEGGRHFGMRIEETISEI